MLDQTIKAIVVANMTEGEIIPVIGELLQWHFVRNPGAAFSIASGLTWLLTLLACVVVGAIIWAAPRIRSVAWAIMLGGLLGGVLGNLVDRLTREPGFARGYVIDYISTPWLVPAIYNIADIAIISSMGLFVILTLRGVNLDGTRDRDNVAAVEAAAEANAGAAHHAESSAASPAAPEPTEPETRPAGQEQ